MPEWLVQPLTFWVDLATIAAIVVGGIWAYLLFIRRRQKYPRAALTHHIVHRRISHDELPDDKVLLRVGLVIENPGEVLLSLISGETRVQQVEPWPKWFLEKVKNGEDPVEEGQTEVNWPYAGEPGERLLQFEKKEREVEPGEKDEIHFDFVLTAECEAVLVYTYIQNQAKLGWRRKGRDIGWGVTSLYDLHNPDGRDV